MVSEPLFLIHIFIFDTNPTVNSNINQCLEVSVYHLIHENEKCLHFNNNMSVIYLIDF